MTALAALLPELLLALTLVGLLLAEITYRGESTRLVTIIALLGMGAALLQIVVGSGGGIVQLLEGVWVGDGLSFFFRMFFVTLALLTVLVAAYSREIPEKRRTEFHALVVGGALALCLLSASVDLILLFSSLLMIHTLGFLMAGYSKRRPGSIEAAVKHLAFSSLALGLFLYASAFFFAQSGTTHLLEIQRVLLVSKTLPPGFWAVLVVLFLSLSFLIAAFPFYLWMPDVLEGAPLPSALFLGLGLPAAGFAVALRFFGVLFQDSTSSWSTQFPWSDWVALASGITMIAGALLGARQVGVRRMLACWVLTQSGFLLMSLLVISPAGLAALLFNLVVGLVSLVGAYSAFSFLSGSLQDDKLTLFQGMLRRAAPESICFLLFLACFLGLPPLPGFVGRFALLTETVGREWYGLSAVAMGSSLLALVSFSRLAFHLSGAYRESGGASVSAPLGQRWFLFTLMIPLVLLTVFANGVLAWGTRILQVILW